MNFIRTLILCPFLILLAQSSYSSETQNNDPMQVDDQTFIQSVSSRLKTGNIHIREAILLCQERGLVYETFNQFFGPLKRHWQQQLPNKHLSTVWNTALRLRQIDTNPKKSRHFKGNPSDARNASPEQMQELDSVMSSLLSCLTNNQVSPGTFSESLPTLMNLMDLIFYNHKICHELAYNKEKNISQIRSAHQIDTNITETAKACFEKYCELNGPNGKIETISVHPETSSDFTKQGASMHFLLFEAYRFSTLHGLVPEFFCDGLGTCNSCLEKIISSLQKWHREYSYYYELITQAKEGEEISQPFSAQVSIKKLLHANYNAIEKLSRGEMFNFVLSKLGGKIGSDGIKIDNDLIKEQISTFFVFNDNLEDPPELQNGL